MNEDIITAFYLIFLIEVCLALLFSYIDKYMTKRYNKKNSKNINISETK